MRFGSAIVLAGALLATACGDRDLFAPDQPVSQGLATATAQVNGAEIFYQRAGSGPAVVLLHGFPQDSSAWRDIAPVLAQRFTVIVPDLRGIGKSKAPEVSAFDSATLASDIHALVSELGLEAPYVVGHDMGGLAAFAYARDYPDEVRGVMLIEMPLPGIRPWNKVVTLPDVWHINFHQAADVPEALIAGREAQYFRTQFFTMGDAAEAIDDAELARYAAAYGSPGQLLAGLGQYRAARENALANRRAPGADVPMTLVGTEGSLAPAMEEMKIDLGARGWSDIDVVSLPGSGHYLLDETPETIMKLIAERAGVSEPALIGASEQPSPRPS